MKLFSPKELSVTYTTRQADDIGKIAYLTTTLNSLQKQVNDENDHFNNRLAEQREIYAEAKENLQKEIKVLESYVSSLRSERASFMIPVDQLKKQAEEALQEATKHARRLADKESDIDDLIEVMAARTSNLTEREQNVKDAERKLNRKIEGAEKEAQKISEGHKKLNLMMSEFKQEVDKRSKEIAEKESVIIIREKSNKDYFDAKEKDFEKREKVIADRRAVLDRMYIEIKRLKNK